MKYASHYSQCYDAFVTKITVPKNQKFSSNTADCTKPSGSIVAGDVLGGETVLTD